LPVACGIRTCGKAESSRSSFLRSYKSPRQDLEISAFDKKSTHLPSKLIRAVLLRLSIHQGIKGHGNFRQIGKPYQLLEKIDLLANIPTP
jgi:hypothetical protein